MLWCRGAPEVGPAAPSQSGPGRKEPSRWWGRGGGGITTRRCTRPWEAGVGETGWEGSAALLSWGGVAGLPHGGEASHPVARGSRKEELDTQMGWLLCECAGGLHNTQASEPLCGAASLSWASPSRPLRPGAQPASLWSTCLQRGAEDPRLWQEAGVAHAEGQGSWSHTLQGGGPSSLPAPCQCDPEPSSRPRTPESSHQGLSLGSQCQEHSGRGPSQRLTQLLVLSIRREPALSPSGPRGAFRQTLWCHGWSRTPAGQQSPGLCRGGRGGRAGCFQDDAQGPPRTEVPAL